MRQEMIKKLLDRFETISLEEMELVRLMNRTDTKYVAHIDKLPEFLQLLEKDYYVQEISGKKMALYQTMYLDTSDFEMFLNHLNGRKQREKIRIREYVDSKQVYLEVKKKNNKGRTNKRRIRIPDYNPVQHNGAVQFISTHAQFAYEALSPHVETMYERITLVNHQKTERITVDINLRFRNYRTNNQSSISDLVVIELKQDKYASSFIRSVMNRLHIYPMRISKYCMGSICTNPQLKYNRYKPKMMKINKLIKNKYEYVR
ncbi:polyphosphate polymerase domain-containing protein [Parabacteroides sp. OttesenSCG-928-G07]|nr:polyphosphate polymerase domain-containing protein [Parabacteroides sp. OttesenSCG-928-G07]